MSTSNSKFLNLSRKYSFLKKIYFFYNVYIRNYKFFFNSSQFSEDKKILELFCENYKGKYLDDGCYHSPRVNNTLILYRKGWKGMNIDLNQFAIDMFNFARPKDINICAALSDKTSTKKVYYLGDLDPKNTLDLNHKKWLNKHFGISNKDIKKKSVKTKKLGELLKKYNFSKIDFMNIDIEGHEIEVLRSLNLKKLKIKVICVEILNYNNKKKQQILTLLKKNGYELKSRFTINYIFQRKMNNFLSKKD